MTAPDRKVYDSDPKRLAEMMGLDAGADRLWRPEELEAIFRHQMSSAVVFDLGALDTALAGKVKTLTAAQGLLVRSFADLFAHPNPPIELLELTKQFAKANRDHPDSALPREIATAVYFTSIAAALVRHGRRITRLDTPTLRRGMNWVLTQTWIDRPTRSLIEGALERLDQVGP